MQYKEFHIDGVKQDKATNIYVLDPTPIGLSFWAKMDSTNRSCSFAGYSFPNKWHFSNGRQYWTSSDRWFAHVALLKKKDSQIWRGLEYRSVDHRGSKNGAGTSLSNLE